MSVVMRWICFTVFGASPPETCKPEISDSFFWNLVQLNPLKLIDDEKHLFSMQSDLEKWKFEILSKNNYLLLL